ncbi:MAG: TIGR03809 family protein [Rhizobiales bacterium]|nr:TIGR03809 family protein [Hyphomicrobiales bacterium]
MTQSDPKSSPEAGRSLVVRWRLLAQKRLDHLVELYESGRWKRYYDEPEFLELIQETRAALKVWHQLAPLDPQPGEPAGIAVSEVLDDSPSLLPPVLVNEVATERELRKA